MSGRLFVIYRWHADATAVAGTLRGRSLTACGSGAAAGGYQIAGQVRINGAPAVNAERPVYAFPVTQIPNAWSSPIDGGFTITGLTSGEYFIVSRDPTGQFDLVGHDAVVAEPSP